MEPKLNFNVDDLQVISRLERYTDDGLFHDVMADLLALHEEVKCLNAFFPSEPQKVDIKWGYECKRCPRRRKRFFMNKKFELSVTLTDLQRQTLLKALDSISKRHPGSAMALQSAKLYQIVFENLKPIHN